MAELIKTQSGEMIDRDKISSPVHRGEIFPMIAMLHRVTNYQQMALIALKRGDQQTLEMALEGANKNLNDLFDEMVRFVGPEVETHVG
jgi:hypothetical protein